MYCYLSFCLYAYFMFWFLLFVAAVVVVVLENKCRFVDHNWLQISCIYTVLLINSIFILFLFVTSYNLQTYIVLCSLIISVSLIMNVESLYFYMFFIQPFLGFMFVNFNIKKKKGGPQSIRCRKALSNIIQRIEKASPIFTKT